MKNTTSRISELDALRGLAVIIVALFHFTTKFEELYTKNLTTKFEFEFGHYGVQLFFIISGFVIFKTINSIRSSNEFIYKRFIRLFPLFWVCVSITYSLTYFLPPGFNRSIFDYLASLTMIPALIGFKPIDGVYWSLIPELFFYLLILILYRFGFLKPKNQNLLYGFLLLWLLLCALNFIFDLPSFIETFLVLKYGYLFVSGINFFIIFEKRSKFINHFIIFLSLVITLLSNDIGLILSVTLFFSIFYLFVYGHIKKIAIKPLLFIGEISYAFYLLHQFIGYTIQYNLISLGVKNYYFLILTPIFLCIGLSYLVTAYIEKPMINFLKSKKIG